MYKKNMITSAVDARILVITLNSRAFWGRGAGRGRTLLFYTSGFCTLVRFIVCRSGTGAGIVYKQDII